MRQSSLRLLAFAKGNGTVAEPEVVNAATLPVTLPFPLTEEYIIAPQTDPGVLWLTEELPYDEVNATGTAVLPFNLPASLATAATRADITGTLTTRRLLFETLHRKRFSRALVDVVLYQDSAANVSIATINPDTKTSLLAFATATQKDYIRRIRVAKQGYGAELTINTTQGRASIRGATIEATIPGQNTKSED